MKIHTYISLGVAGFLAIGAMSCSTVTDPFGGTGTGKTALDSLIGSRLGGGAVDTLHMVLDSLGNRKMPHDSLGGNGGGHRGGGHPHDSLGGHPPDSLHFPPHDSLHFPPHDSLGVHPPDSLGGHPPDSLGHRGPGRRH